MGNSRLEVRTTRETGTGVREGRAISTLTGGSKSRSSSKAGAWKRLLGGKGTPGSYSSRYTKYPKKERGIKSKQKKNSENRIFD